MKIEAPVPEEDKVVEKTPEELLGAEIDAIQQEFESLKEKRAAVKADIIQPLELAGVVGFLPNLVLKKAEEALEKHLITDETLGDIKEAILVAKNKDAKLSRERKSSNKVQFILNRPLSGDYSLGDMMSLGEKAFKAGEIIEKHYFLIKKYDARERQTSQYPETSQKDIFSMDPTAISYEND